MSRNEIGKANDTMNQAERRKQSRGGNPKGIVSSSCGVPRTLPAARRNACGACQNVSPVSREQSAVRRKLHCARNPFSAMRRNDSEARRKVSGARLVQSGARRNLPDVLSDSPEARHRLSANSLDLSCLGWNGLFPPSHFAEQRAGAVAKLGPVFFAPPRLCAFALNFHLRN